MRCSIIFFLNVIMYEDYTHTHTHRVIVYEDYTHTHTHTHVCIKLNEMSKKGF